MKTALDERKKTMLCEKCGTENAEGSKFCKKCGLVFGEPEPERESVDHSSGGTALREKEETVRTRTSPLAVHMKEKNEKEEAKIRRKLARGRIWAVLAIVMIVAFLAENTFLILYKVGVFGQKPTAPAASSGVVAEGDTAAPTTELSSATLAGKWNYSYSLVKHYDSDYSGDYETVTETIVSEGTADFVDKGEDHMTVLVYPGTMTVDGADVALGTTPEAFSGWYKDGSVGIQMKGTEQKFFAPGGAEPLCISFPISPGVPLAGTYAQTYDKTVTEMNMRYEIRISFSKAE